MAGKRDKPAPKLGIVPKFGSILRRVATLSNPSLPTGSRTLLLEGPFASDGQLQGLNCNTRAYLRTRKGRGHAVQVINKQSQTNGTEIPGTVSQ